MVKVLCMKNLVQDSDGKGRSPIRQADSPSSPGGRGRAQEETGPQPKSVHDVDIRNTLPLIAHTNSYTFMKLTAGGYLCQWGGGLARHYW